jgi:HK97 family phage portal protein
MFGWAKRIEKRYRQTAGVILSDDGAASIFGIHPASSGEVVTEFTALELATVWACINVIADTVSTLRWPVYERLEGDARTPAPAHPIYRLLYERPNSEQSSVDFRTMMQAHACMWHGAYAEIEREADGTPIALWPIAPNRVMPRRVGGELKWQISPPAEMDEVIANPDTRGRGMVTLADRDVFRINGLQFVGPKAISLITVARESFGLSMAAAKYGSQFFGNGSALNNMFSLPGNPDEEKRRTWKRDIEGALSGNARFRVLVVPDGVKVQNFGVDPEKAQSIETRQFQIYEVCRWFGVPPHMVWELENAHFNTVEEQGLNFTQRLLKWTQRWDAEANQKMLRPSERVRYFAEMDVDSVSRASLDKRQSFYQTGLQNGFLSPNDVRRMERMNPLPPESGGDVYMRQVNMQSLNTGGESQDDTPSTQEPTVDSRAADRIAAHQDAIGDVVFRLATRASRAIEGKAGKVHGEELRTWCAGWWGDTEQRTAMRAQLAPHIRAAVVAVRGDSVAVADTMAGGMADEIVSALEASFVDDPARREDIVATVPNALAEDLMNKIGGIHAEVH